MSETTRYRDQAMTVTCPPELGGCGAGPGERCTPPAGGLVHKARADAWMVQTKPDPAPWAIVEDHPQRASYVPSPEPELPGMWEPADFAGGQTDQPGPGQPCPCPNLAGDCDGQHAEPPWGLDCLCGTPRDGDCPMHDAEGPVYFTTQAAEAVLSAPVMCTNPEHQPGEHGASCVPPADPAIPALRLLRAIYGLCIYCDRADDHDHTPNLAGLDLVGIPVACWGTKCGATIQLRTDHRWYDFGTDQRHTCHDAKDWPEGTRS